MIMMRGAAGGEAEEVWWSIWVGKPSDIDPIRRSTKVQFINRLKKFHRMDIFYWKVINVYIIVPTFRSPGSWNESGRRFVIGDQEGERLEIRCLAYRRGWRDWE